MRLTEKCSPTQYEQPAWKLYDELSPLIGHILDNKFESPHISVYEHERHTSTDVFNHLDFDIGNESAGDYGNGNLYPEELDVARALAVKEADRRLNLVGDVGVGKSTFINHLIDAHNASSAFMVGCTLYLDWNDFTASLDDPIPAIHKRFVDRVSMQMEKQYGIKDLQDADDAIFECAELFSKDRCLAYRHSGEDRANKAIQYIERAWSENPLSFTVERINFFCRENINEMLIVFDNIDHLHIRVLDCLMEFITEIQKRTLPLVLVAMRDHTYERGGFSAYNPDKAVLSWTMRLRPPNIRLMVERRVKYFFDSADGASRRKKVSFGAGSYRVSEDTSSICAALLRSSISTDAIYEVVANYSNFNIRQVFSSLQKIVSCPGMASFEGQFAARRDIQLQLGLDEFLISLGLDGHYLFYPEHSELFNPYSAGLDVNPLDRLVGVRILQLLHNRTSPLAYSELLERFAEWGYNKRAVEMQVLSMVRKDIVWTTSGSPEHFGLESKVRLSYRGILYAKRFLRRAVFNYMMSFDAETPDESHAVLRHHKSEFKRELESFAALGEPVELDHVCQRVVGLASLLFEAEQHEILMLGKKGGFESFKVDVAPKSISIEIVSGLAQLIRKTLEAGSSPFRYIAPSTQTLRDVSNAQERFLNELGQTWTTD